MRNISHKISISMNNFDSHVYSDLPFCFSFRIFEQIKNNLSDKQSRGKLILTLLIPSMRENYEIMAFFTEFSDVRSTNSGFGTFSSPPSPWEILENVWVNEQKKLDNFKNCRIPPLQMVIGLGIPLSEYQNLFSFFLTHFHRVLVCCISNNFLLTVLLESRFCHPWFQVTLKRILRPSFLFYRPTTRRFIKGAP